MAWPPERGRPDDSAAARTRRILGAYNRGLLLFGLLAIAGAAVCVVVLVAG